MTSINYIIAVYNTDLCTRGDSVVIRFKMINVSFIADRSDVNIIYTFINQIKYLYTYTGNT